VTPPAAIYLIPKTLNAWNDLGGSALKEKTTTFTTEIKENTEKDNYNSQG